MKFATICHNGTEQPALLVQNETAVLPLPALGLPFATLLSFIEAGEEALARLLEEVACQGEKGAIPLAQVRLEAPVPHPPHDLLCLGQNYAAHAEESARFLGAAEREAPQTRREKAPVYFSKRVLRATGPGGVVPAHADLTTQLDYEAELAVVIGKTASRVPPERVYDYLFGYTVANDVSARDLQRRHVQYTFAKGLDGFACLGPWIVTGDELPNPGALAIRSYVNGELRQDSHTSLLLYDIPYIVSHLSQGMTLCPGDIILTGTPAGVGMGFLPPRFLQKGDEVVCEIERIGALRNTIG